MTVRIDIVIGGVNCRDQIVTLPYRERLRYTSIRGNRRVLSYVLLVRLLSKGRTVLFVFLQSLRTLICSGAGVALKRFLIGMCS